MEGGRVTIHGSGFPIDRPHLPDVTFGETPARAVFASPSTISVLVPEGLDGGQTAVRVEGVPGETALLEVGTQESRLLVQAVPVPRREHDHDRLARVAR